MGALLNLGHTFGHAIETEMGYGAWMHGEAVAAGCVLAGRCRRNWGAFRPPMLPGQGLCSLQ